MTDRPCCPGCGTTKCPRPGPECDYLPLEDRVRLRWWKVQGWFRRCPECGQRGYSTVAPRWEDDKVAHMLGLINDDHCRCRCCGK